MAIPILFQLVFFWHVLTVEDSTRTTHEQLVEANRIAGAAGRVVALGNDAEYAVIAFLVTGNEAHLDIHLPDMTGLDALASIRADDRTKRIPAIALTVHALQADMEHGLATGFRHYVTKPLDEPGFLAMLDGILGFPETKAERTI